MNRSSIKLSNFSATWPQVKNRQNTSTGYLVCTDRYSSVGSSGHRFHGSYMDLENRAGSASHIYRPRNPQDIDICKDKTSHMHICHMHTSHMHTCHRHTFKMHTCHRHTCHKHT